MSNFKFGHTAKEKSSDLKNRSREITHKGHGYKRVIKRLVGYIGKVQHLCNTVKEKIIE